MIYFMFPGNDLPQFINAANQELLNLASGSETSDLGELRQAFEKKQDPASDPKVKKYFNTIGNLYAHRTDSHFYDVAQQASQQITSDVIRNLDNQLKPLAEALAENYANVAKVSAVYSKIKEIQEEWDLIEAIKENLEERRSVLILKDYTLNNSSACVEFLSLLPHVTELNIQNTGLGDIFSGIGNLQNLQIIRIENAEDFTSFHGIEALSHLRAIELTNGGESIGLAPLRSIDSLQTVTINGQNKGWRLHGNFDNENGQLAQDNLPPSPDSRQEVDLERLTASSGVESAIEEWGMLDNIQDLLITTTGGTTASDFRQTTHSAESVNSLFSPAELGQAMVVNGETERSGTLHNDANSAHPLGEGTLSLESLDFERRTQ